MRAIAFLLTFTLVFCGATVAGPTDHGPNAGLFVFDVAPVDPGAPLVLASR
jgi:hypothetical protein